MDHASGDAEQRTAAAERKVALLTERAAHIEQLVQQMSTAPPTPAPASSAASLPPSSAAFLLAQLQSLRVALSADEDERRRLTDENGKLRYRIAILLRSLDEAEAKAAGGHGGGSGGSGSGGGGGDSEASVGQHSVGDVKHVLDKLAA